MVVSLGKILERINSYMSNNSLEIKKPLWIALSNLFLDRELSENDFTYIASVIKESELSIKQVEQILKEEVLPICIPNIKSISGEWAGFDEKWLIESIVKLKKLRPLQKAIHKNDYKLIKDEWEQVLSIINS